MLPPDLAADADLYEEVMAQLAEPAMPPVSLAVIGMTPGGPAANFSEDDEVPFELPPAKIVVRLLMTAPNSAANAASTIDSRLRTLNSAFTQQPYTDFFASWEIAPSDDGSTLSIDFTLADETLAAIWIQLFFRRDLLFLAW
jgi:hypothetical protein